MSFTTDSLSDSEDNDAPKPTPSHLETLLTSVKSMTDFFSTGTKELIMPTITVEGVGRLSFPVPEEQTQLMISTANRAPFGRGEHTVLDLKVRRVWQLPREAVAISGESWNLAMSEVLKKASHQSRKQIHVLL